MKYVHGKHIALVDPIKAIIEQDYFLWLIYQCEKNFDIDEKWWAEGLPPVVDEWPKP